MLGSCFDWTFDRKADDPGERSRWSAIRTLKFALAGVVESVGAEYTINRILQQLGLRIVTWWQPQSSDRPENGGATRMSMGRMALLAVAIEATAVLILVLVVAVFGPAEPAAAEAYAQRLGYWVGPIAGFILCLGGGWLVARPLQERQVQRGALLGTMVAAIDVAILVAGGATFQPIFVLSNLGRIVAGSLGGLSASRTSELTE